MKSIKKIIIFLITFSLGIGCIQPNLFSMKKSTEDILITNEEFIFLKKLHQLNIYIQKIKNSTPLDEIKDKLFDIANKKVSSEILKKIQKELLFILDFISGKEIKDVKNDLQKTITNLRKELYTITIKNMDRKKSIEIPTEELEDYVSRISKLDIIPKESDFRNIARTEIVSSSYRRTERKIPGLLKELLITSGYYVLQENLEKLIDLLTNRPKNKKQLQECRIDIEKIRIIMDIYRDKYFNFSTKIITNVQENELIRLVFESEESVIKRYIGTIRPLIEIILKNPKKILKNFAKEFAKELDNLRKMQVNIKSNNKTSAKTIINDIKGRNWPIQVLGNLKRDSEILAKILEIDISEIWQEYLNHDLLTDIFDNRFESVEKDALRQIEDLQKTFDFKILNKQCNYL